MCLLKGCTLCRRPLVNGKFMACRSCTKKNIKTTGISEALDLHFDTWCWHARPPVCSYLHQLSLAPIISWHRIASLTSIISICDFLPLSSHLAPDECSQARLSAPLACSIARVDIVCTWFVFVTRTLSGSVDAYCLAPGSAGAKWKQHDHLCSSASCTASEAESFSCRSCSIQRISSSSSLS